jgi:hypothetical protein
MAETHCDHECATWWSYYLKVLLLCSDSINRRHKLRTTDNVFKKQYMYILFNTRLYIYIYIYIHTHTHTHTHIHTYIHTYIHIHRVACIHKHTHTYICVCVGVYIYIYMYIYSRVFNKRLYINIDTCVCSVSDSCWMSTVLKRTQYVTFAPFFYFPFFFLSDGWLILVTTGASCHHSTKQGQQVF